MDSPDPGSSNLFPPSPPTRTRSAPATFQGSEPASSAAPPVPSPPPPSVRTITNQGTPDPSLGLPDDDITNPLAFRTMEELTQKLLSPPAKSWSPTHPNGTVYYDRVCIRLEWVKKVVTEKHFIFDPAKSRSVLRNDSKIRTHGLAYGLPRRYWEWLCGIAVSNAPFMATRDMLWIARGEFVRMAYP